MLRESSRERYQMQYRALTWLLIILSLNAFGDTFFRYLISDSYHRGRDTIGIQLECSKIFDWVCLAMYVGGVAHWAKSSGSVLARASVLFVFLQVVAHILTLMVLNGVLFTTETSALGQELSIVTLSTGFISFTLLLLACAQTGSSRFERALAMAPICIAFTSIFLLSELGMSPHSLVLIKIATPALVALPAIVLLFRCRGRIARAQETALMAPMSAPGWTIGVTGAKVIRMAQIVRLLMMAIVLVTAVLSSHSLGGHEGVATVLLGVVVIGLVVTVFEAVGLARLSQLPVASEAVGVASAAFYMTLLGLMTSGIACLVQLLVTENHQVFIIQRMTQWATIMSACAMVALIMLLRRIGLRLNEGASMMGAYRAFSAWALAGLLGAVLNPIFGRFLNGNTEYALGIWVAVLSLWGVIEVFVLLRSTIRTLERHECAE